MARSQYSIGQEVHSLLDSARFEYACLSSFWLLLYLRCIEDTVRYDKLTERMARLGLLFSPHNLPTLPKAQQLRLHDLDLPDDIHHGRFYRRVACTGLEHSDRYPNQVRIRILCDHNSSWWWVQQLPCLRIFWQSSASRRWVNNSWHLILHYDA